VGEGGGGSGTGGWGSDIWGQMRAERKGPGAGKEERRTFLIGGKSRAVDESIAYRVEMDF